MKVLVVGGGGREHALAWKLALSAQVSEIYIAPGNPGTASVGTNVPISAEDLDGLASFAKDNSIDLTVVGPEAPLVAGITDLFQEQGLTVFGPTQATAALEGSKTFAKQFMEEHRIPTARSKTFETIQPASEYIHQVGTPIVVKADGLAAGKGVTVAHDIETAKSALSDCFVGRVFGEAGSRVVIEEYLEGEEASVLAICDGETFVSLPPSQDHKPAYDHDKGPNTGGMGAYCPAPIMTEDLARRVDEEVIRPVVEGMAQRGTPFTGILYAGLMISGEDFKVLEFNCRMGDPETQAVLPVVDADLAELFLLASRGDLKSFAGSLEPNGACVSVVMAAGGYPGPYEKGIPISGIDNAEVDPEVTVFHAGTKIGDDGFLATSGGRILGVTGKARDIAAAIDRAYKALGNIHFAGAHYRTDIGEKALDRLTACS